VPTPESTATQTPDPLAIYQAGLRPAFQGDLEAYPDLPRYDLDLQFLPSQGAIRGTQTVQWINTTGQPQDAVVFRLYQNYPADIYSSGAPTGMEIVRASVAGEPVEHSYMAQQTAVQVPLLALLQPGEQIDVLLEYTAQISPSADGTWVLPSYNPMLAVWQSDGWRLDVTQFPDIVFSESAYYRATIAIPADLTLVATGTTIEHTDVGEGRTAYTVVTGPVRQFAFAVGDFVAVQQQAGDVTVTVYQAAQTGFDATFVAQVAADALQVFEQRFGPYPYAELDIHLHPYRFDAGDEYPGLIWVYSDGPSDAGLRFVTAHEVSHQWWFAVVGNDVYQEPWLDEAFAQYSAIIYAEDVLGTAAAQADWEREVVSRYRSAVQGGDLPVGLSITAYRDFGHYYQTVYGKGAWVLQELRRELGDAVFFQVLQTYYTQHRYGVARTGDFQRVAEEVSGRDLSLFFTQRITGASP
jgi:hypothetical protein